MPKRKPSIQYGWRDQGQKQPRECERCGVPLKTTSDELVSLCGDCSGRRKRRLADKSEVVDRDEIEADEERAANRDAFVDYLTEWEHGE